MDWGPTIGDVRIAGIMTEYSVMLAPQPESEVHACLRAWLDEHLTPVQRTTVLVRQFLRCKTRGMFLRCKTYGHDQRRVDYCVVIRSDAVVAEELHAIGVAAAQHTQPEDVGAGAAATAQTTVEDAVPMEDGMAVVGLAQAHPAAHPVAPPAAVPAPAAVAAPATMLALIEVFFAIKLPETPQSELWAVVQPLAEIPHYYHAVDATALPDETWASMRQWMQSGVLLRQATSISRTATAALPKKMVRLTDVLEKRCLLDTPGADCMMVARMQNFVEEL